MTRRIVVTGAAGFVGGRLAKALLDDGHAVKAIDRNAPKPGSPIAGIWRRADLCLPEQYQDVLDDASIVFHLGAVTGKARPAAYQRSNVEATRALLNACQARNIEQFIFLSSIAVNFANPRFYPYAVSKAEAEKLVKASGLNTTIVRPTMILGDGSPIEASLRKLAAMPIVPVMGDGTAKVQPIHIDDVVRFLSGVVNLKQVYNATIELGGPEVMSIEELIVSLRPEDRNGALRFVHLPAGLAQRLLAAVEPILLPVLPLTAGQIATFVNDGVAVPCDLAGLASLAPQRAMSRARGKSDWAH
jgi:NADH dehydrogenase